jgi:hypothetical protein
MLALTLAAVFALCLQAQERPRDTYVVTLPAPANAAPGGDPVWNRLPGTDSSATVSALRQGLMWKASSATNTVYLLGSIHLASSDMYPLPQHIEDAFRNSALLVVEVDLNKVDQKKLQAMFAARGLYPPDDSLWNHISPDTKELVHRFCAENGLAPEAFARLKPWLAAITVSMLHVQKTGMRMELGMDRYFLEQAKGAMQVQQLESAEWQLRLLSNIAEMQQERYLAASLSSASANGQMATALQAAWLSGDGDRLAGLISTEMRDSAEVGKKIFADRNPHMADVVEQCLKSGTQSFVVVGAGHLVGKDGVVRLLQKRGFHVEQVLSTN